jgi:hypothetical protein
VSDWGGPCHQCGHPSSYHGATFCRCEAGSTRKRMCDCTGYNTTRGYVAIAAVLIWLDRNGIDRDRFLEELA